MRTVGSRGLTAVNLGARACLSWAGACMDGMYVEGSMGRPSGELFAVLAADSKRRLRHSSGFSAIVFLSILFSFPIIGSIFANSRSTSSRRKSHLKSSVSSRKLCVFFSRVSVSFLFWPLQILIIIASVATFVIVLFS